MAGLEDDALGLRPEQRSVRVVVRIRPLLPQDGEYAESTALRVEDGGQEVSLLTSSSGPDVAAKAALSSQMGAGRRYAFDNVFNVETLQVNYWNGGFRSAGHAAEAKSTTQACKHPSKCTHPACKASGAASETRAVGSD